LVSEEEDGSKLPCIYPDGANRKCFLDSNVPGKLEEAFRQDACIMDARNHNLLENKGHERANDLAGSTSQASQFLSSLCRLGHTYGSGTHYGATHADTPASGGNKASMKAAAGGCEQFKVYYLNFTPVFSSRSRTEEESFLASTLPWASLSGDENKNASFILFRFTSDVQVCSGFLSQA